MVNDIAYLDIPRKDQEKLINSIKTGAEIINFPLHKIRFDPDYQLIADELTNAWQYSISKISRPF